MSHRRRRRPQPRLSPKALARGARGDAAAPRYVAEPLERRVLFSTISWTLGAPGDFGNPTNWSSGTVPGPSDDVVINFAGGTGDVAVTTAVNVNSITSANPIDVGSTGTLGVITTADLAAPLNLNGGNVVGSATCNLNGGLNWANGTVNVTGAINLAAGTTSDVNGATASLVAGSLQNSGTLMLAGVAFSLGANAGIANQATGTLQIMDNVTIDGASSTSDSLYNVFGGKIAIPSGSALVVGNNVPFTNNGTVADAGDLRIASPAAGPGAVFDTGTAGTIEFNGTPATVYAFGGSCQFLGGGSLSLSGGSLSIGGSYDLAGSTTVAGGTTITFDGANVHAGTLTMQPGSQLSGAGVVQVDAQFNWLGGVQFGTGKTIVSATAGFFISASATGLTLDTRELDVAGSGTDAAFVPLYLANGAVLNVVPGGSLTFNALNSGGGLAYDSGATPTIDNAGTIGVSAGPAAHVLLSAGLDFNNSGAVIIVSGTVDVAANFVNAGGAIALQGGTVFASQPLDLGTGKLTGFGVYDGSVIANGTVAPTSGGSAATDVLQILGDYISTPSTVFVFNIPAATVPDYGTLQVNGTAAIDGELMVSRGSDYPTPAAGDAFQPIKYTSHTGDFAAANGLHAGPGLDFNETTGPAGVTLVVGPPPTLVAPPTDGVLTGTGTLVSDNVGVSLVNGTVTITDNGVTQTFSQSSVTSISIDAGGGDDSVVLAPDFPIPVVLSGGSGNDTLGGGAAADTLHGGSGNDSINGGGGNDVVMGGVGADSISGGAGNDTVDGGAGPDTVSGGAGDNVVSGGAGADLLLGGTGADTVHGGAGNDVVVSDGGNGQLFGGAGDDLFVNAGTGHDTIDGGDGFNAARRDPGGTLLNVQLIYDPNAPIAPLPPEPDPLAAAPAAAAAFPAIFNTALATRAVAAAATTPATAGVVGGALNITGTAADDFIDVRTSGNHLLVTLARGLAPQSFPLAGLTGISVSGGDGNDLINAQEDVTLPMTVDGGAGNDTVRTGAGNDSVNGGDGNDSIVGRAGNDTLFGGNGNDSIYGLRGADSLSGGAGDDYLDGGIGADTLDGGAGNDFLNPGIRASTSGPDAGDVLIGGLGVDTAVYTARLDNLTLAADGIAHSGGAGETDRIMPDVENVLGGEGNDTITGTALAGAFLSGGKGADSLVGGAFNDVLVGCLGPDTVDGGAGHNALFLRQVPGDRDRYVAHATIELKDVDTLDLAM